MQVSEGKPIDIMCPDGYVVKGLLYAPQGEPKANVMLSGGVGIPQRFYRKFAEFLAENGFAVLTYDYRGTGLSGPPRQPGRKFRAIDWALLDMDSALQTLHGQWPGQRLLLICHSFGGQVVGLLPSWHLLHGIVMVGSGTGAQRTYGLPQQLRNGLMWWGLLPLFDATRGVLPGWVMGGQDVPASVAREWRKWCHSPHYLFSHIGTSIPAHHDHYASLKVPIVMWQFADDSIITEKGARLLATRFTRCALDFRMIDPKALAMRPVGHVGFFREMLKDAFWHRAVQDFDAMLAQAKTAN